MIISWSKNDSRGAQNPLSRNWMLHGVCGNVAGYAYISEKGLIAVEYLIGLPTPTVR